MGDRLTAGQRPLKPLMKVRLLLPQQDILVYIQIEILRSVDEASKAKGLAVVIDVFRAFSVEAYAFANGAKKIIPVLTLEEAYELKEEYPDYILIGERHGIKPEGFDYGNSPTEILYEDFSEKTIVHTTSNGTRGLMNAVQADAILTGSFLTADSIVRYIKEKKSEHVSLISTSGDSTADNEDIFLAYYLRDRLQNIEVHESDIKTLLGKTAAYSRLFKEIGVPATDFDLCLDFNRFDFVIKEVDKNDQMYLIRQDPPFS